jgi:hypothetical protein
MYGTNFRFFEDSKSGGTGQESFVLNVLKEKKNGHYVELGAFHSQNGSNTWLLETGYDWSGLALDIVPAFAEEINANRKNGCVLADATTFDYRKYFEENNFPKQIDYLQVDIDSGYDNQGNPVGNPNQSLLGLIALPLNVYRFTVITFEHDGLSDYKSAPMRDAQREILTSLGYKLVQRHTFEDWWVDATVIPYQEFKEYFYMGAP